MTLRRVHLPPERIRDGRALLTPEARHYLCNVLRLAPGAELEVFDGCGGVYRASLAGPEALELGPRREAPPPGARIWLAFALARGEKGDLVVQKATELGVSRLLPFTAARSVARLEGTRAAERARRWRRIAAEAARQSGRADVPEVDAPAALASALGAAPASYARFVLCADGEPLAPLSPAHGILAVVGPEGGLAPEEVDACVAAGCRVVGLGPRTLRAETAAIAAVALLQFAAGDMGGARP
jgi:16S rRNA (uracil1498-N3)-methyltransferase